MRKKVCRFCQERAFGVEFRDADRLLKFLTEKGKILPQRITGNCASHQRMLARSIKRARHAALIPFLID
jgi:small subunit ribosomal protein S18